MPKTFLGKTAVVTGAASGIGLATTKMLLAGGARVVMVDRNEVALQHLASELGSQSLPHVTDLLNPESCARMVPAILAATGQIDILHCNAGTYIGGELTETTADDIDRMLNLNVNAVIKNVHAVIPHMVERGTGDIIVTCSVAGHFPTFWEPVYSGSKWAITSFVQGMRRQMVPHGIRVAQISPGPVASALLADWPEENLRAAREAGGLIEPEDVAEAIMFMLTRKRTITIRDMIILPSNFDRV